LVLVVLRLPHLMLAHIGDDERLAVGEAPEIVDDVRGVEMSVIGKVLNVAHGRIALQRRDMREPGSAIHWGDMRQPFVERGAQILRNRYIDANVLIELGAIDVDVNLSSGGRVRLEVAGYAVVEAHPQRDEEVGLLD